MARKNWRVNSENPSLSGPSTHKDSHGVFGSKSRSNDLPPPETQGVGCKKRVRFADLDSSKLDESTSVPRGRNEDTRSGDPKTSEFASFKKLKEDAQRFHSNPLPQHKTQSINLKASHHSRERIIIENRDKGLSPSLPKNVTPDHLFTYVSTPDNASLKSGVDMKRAGTTTDTHKMQENMDKYGAPSKNAGVFSRKRHKLKQLVAKTLSLEVDELFSKGHDIVSVLLSKLFPESNKNKSSDDLKNRTLEKDSKSRSFTSPEFNLRNKSQWTPEINFLELECTPSLDVGFPSYWSETRKKKLPKPNFLNYYPHETFLDNRVIELDYERSTPVFLTQGDSAIDLDIKRHKHFTSRHLKDLDEFHYSSKPLHGQESQALLLGWDVDNMVNECNLPTVSQNTELSLNPFVSSLYGDDPQKNPVESYTAKEVYYPIKPSYKRETPSLLLGWDGVDKSNLPTTSQNTELSFNCFLPSSHGDDQEKNLDDSFGESRLCMESLVPYHPPTCQNTELSLNCFLSSLPGDDKKRQLDDSFSESRLFTNNFSSCLPDMTNMRCSNYDITCNGRDTFLSPLNQLWFMRKILNERKHCPDTALSSTGFDFYVEPESKQVSEFSSDHCFYALKCPQSEHLSSYLTGDAKESYDLSHRGICKHFEDVIHTHNWSSNYLQFALDKEKSYPLLLDKSYWDEESYDQKYSDKDEVKF